MMIEKKKNPYNVAIVLFVAFGSLAFGYSVGIISTTLAQPSFMFVVTLYLLWNISLSVPIVPTSSWTRVLIELPSKEQ
jgi:hypothetical protein